MHRLFWCVAIAFVLSGCSHQLLDRTQQSQRDNSLAHLRNELPRTYQLITDVGAGGALVILHTGSAPAYIEPGDDPVTAFSNLSGSSNLVDARCYYVHRYEDSIEPESLSCSSIEKQARLRSEASKDIQVLRGETKGLRNEMSAVKTSNTKLDKSVKDFDEALATAFELGVVNADMITAHSKSISEMADYLRESRQNLAELNATVAKLANDFKANADQINIAVSKLPK
jgi:hypothetical protein